VILVLQSTGA